MKGCKPESIVLNHVGKLQLANEIRVLLELGEKSDDALEGGEKEFEESGSCVDQAADY